MRHKKAEAEIIERWRAAKLGNSHVEDGVRWCTVHIACEGDPREEVLSLLGEHLAEKRTKKGKADE